VTVTVPDKFRYPEASRQLVYEVFGGEYESGFFGSSLKILDLGANVGAFSVWATKRWPHSHVEAYEPHPETFAYLTANAAAFGAIACHHAAVAAGAGDRATLWGRCAGDGEAGLVQHARSTFHDLSVGTCYEVPLVHPADLPAGDIVKIDVEGAEADILEHMDVSGASLILLEYQTRENRDRIKALLRDSFTVVFEDEVLWDELLRWPACGYRRELAGNSYGRLFLARRRAANASQGLRPRGD
jgi:FkbM family methyltransferase